MAVNCPATSRPEAFIPLLANIASTVDVGSLIGQVAGGGVAGAVLTAIVGLVKSKMA